MPAGFIDSLIMIMLITLIPTLELRASIPAGILGMSIPTPLGIMSLSALPAGVVISIALLTNILLGILLYELLDRLIRLLEHIPRVKKWYQRYEEHLLAKTRNWRRIEWLMLAGFIGIPLPGSGVYSGSILARALLLSRRDAYKAIILGVSIAGSIVSILTLMGSMVFS